MTKRRLHSAVLFVAIVTFGSAALAAPVEIKVRTMVRERPFTSARIVDRLPAGKKVPMLGQTADGNWVHVRGAHEGWIQASVVKGLRAKDEEAPADAADQDPARPLAKPRSVRPEAWVSKSLYHEGEDLKLIVSLNEANLYGRPANTGAVLGVLRRGEQVQLVKKSADKKWINVDIGGGETAWIEARAVKPGRVKSTPSPDESADEPAAPAPTITPEGAKRKARLAQADEPPSEAAPGPEELPPPPPSRKQRRQAKIDTTLPSEDPPPTRKRRDTENETPPGLAADPQSGGSEQPAEPKKKRKQRRLASRIDENSEAATPEPTEPVVVRDSMTSRGKVYVSPGARAGIAILSQRFTSNGTGPLTNYEGSTNAFGAQIGLGLYGTSGKYMFFGADASYTFAGGAALRYAIPGAGSTVTLGVQSHTLDAGVAAGLHFGVLGGLNLRLRIGGQLLANLVQPDQTVRLPRDNIYGMTIGVGLNVPTLFTLGGRPLGVWLFGGGLVPAARMQTPGLEEGAQSTTFGALFGGGLSLILMKPSFESYKGQLGVEAAYSYEFVATHFTGLARRNNSITVADRGTAQHLISLGLGFYY